MPYQLTRQKQTKRRRSGFENWRNERRKQRRKLGKRYDELEKHETTQSLTAKILAVIQLDVHLRLREMDRAKDTDADFLPLRVGCDGRRPHHAGDTTRSAKGGTILTGRGSADVMTIQTPTAEGDVDYYS